MAVCIFEVLTRPRVSVCGPLAFCLCHGNALFSSYVAQDLCFKAGLSAKLLNSIKMILMQINIIFTGKVLHLASFWKWEFLEIGNGLSYMLFPCVGFFSKSVGKNCPSWTRMFSFQYITFLPIGAWTAGAKQLPSVINDAITKRAAKAKINWLFIFQDNGKYSSAFICT